MPRGSIPTLSSRLVLEATDFLDDLSTVGTTPWRHVQIRKCRAPTTPLADLAPVPGWNLDYSAAAIHRGRLFPSIAAAPSEHLFLSFDIHTRDGAAILYRTTLRIKVSSVASGLQRDAKAVQWEILLLLFVVLYWSVSERSYADKEIVPNSRHSGVACFSSKHLTCRWDVNFNRLYFNAHISRGTYDFIHRKKSNNVISYNSFRILLRAAETKCCEMRHEGICDLMKFEGNSTYNTKPQR